MHSKVASAPNTQNPISKAILRYEAEYSPFIIQMRLPEGEVLAAKMSGRARQSKFEMEPCH
jgi:hypothetical protein